MMTCACHSADRFECFALRYGGLHRSASDEYCECGCHETDPDEEEAGVSDMTKARNSK